MKAASRELIEHGRTGLWSDGSVNAIAGSIVELLGQPEQRSRFGWAGREVLRTSYTKETTLLLHLGQWGITPANHAG
jgi:glycosyltransferase involved in cell wall biosynthesis